MLAMKSSSDMKVIESTEFIIRHKNYQDKALSEYRWDRPF